MPRVVGLASRGAKRSNERKSADGVEGRKGMKAVRTGGVARAADVEEAADSVVVVLESRVWRDNADGERDKRERKRGAGKRTGGQRGGRAKRRGVAGGGAEGRGGLCCDRFRLVGWCLKHHVM